MNDIFSKNLKALLKKDKSLVDMILPLSDKNIYMQSSKTGLPVLTVNEDGNFISLDSLDDPVKKVQEKLISLQTGEINRWIIVGLGSGYRLLEVMRIARNQSKFLLIEFDLVCIKHTLSFVDLSAMIDSDMIHIYWDIKKEFSETYEKYIDRKSFIGIGIIVEESSSQNRKIKHDKIVDKINYYSRKFKIDLDSTAESFWLVFQNQIENLPFILKGKRVESLFGKFQDIPAIIVSAGPSLDRYIDDLVNVRDHSVLIAVDTAARALQKKDITPHFILSADPYVKNYFHFLDVTLKGSYLVIEPRVNTRIPAVLPENLFIASFGNAFMKILEKAIGGFGDLETWGSVSMMAFDFALRMGCEPIILLGQDLAFSGNRKHCRGTYFEDKSRMYGLYEKKIKQDRLIENTIKTEDIFGFDIFTDEMMLNYSMHLSQRIKKYGRRCINATEGGILKDNLIIKPFGKVLIEDLQKEIDVEYLLSTAEGFLPENSAKLISTELIQVKNMMNEISGLCKQALHLKRPTKSSSQKYQDYGNSLESIRKRVVQMVVNDPHAELLKEANERTFFTFQQKVSISCNNMDSIFDMFITLFEETKRKTDLIIKYLDDFYFNKVESLSDKI
jgi:hypothetical protein